MTALTFCRALDTAQTPCVIATITSQEDIREIQQTQHAAKPTFCELRADILTAVERTSACNALIDTQRLFTVRARAEGGKADDDTVRMRLYEQYAAHVTAFDIELGAAITADVCALARTHAIAVVGSLHDFAHTPTDAAFEAAAQRAHDAGVSVCKLAVTMHTRDDLVRAAHFLAARSRDAHDTMRYAVVGMGTFGKYSRVVLPIFGSCLVYVSVGTPLVAGQWRLDDYTTLMQSLYDDCK